MRVRLENYCSMFYNKYKMGFVSSRPYNIKSKISEIGFHICSSKWGKGYTSEAARGGMKYAFENLKINRLFAGHNPKNEVSCKILKKLGFRYTHDEYYEPTGLKHPSYLLLSTQRS
jgi:RimJ/RimL family protein N-acetyltransferase